MSNEITNEKLFEFMTSMYSEMQGGLSELRNEMQSGFGKMESEIGEIKNRVILIEQDHGNKLEALLDG